MYTKIVDHLGDALPPADKIISHGIKVQFNILEQSGIFNGVLVGLVPESCLILLIKGYVDIETLADVQIAVSYFYEGSMIEFRTKITAVQTQPGPFVFLKYPRKISKKDLRTLDRTPCYLPVLVRLKGEALRGVINNISDSGCNVLYKGQSGDLDSRFVLQDIIHLDFKLPGAPGDISIAGKIRSIKKEPLQLNIGIQFPGLETDIEQRITDFIDSVS